MLYSGFPYSTAASQSISNIAPSNHILTPIPTTYNSINTPTPFPSFTTTTQQYPFQEFYAPPQASVNHHLIYPAQTPVLFPTYTSDSPWTTAQPPQPSPKLDIKQDDVGNPQENLLVSCALQEDDNYVESPDEEVAVGQLKFSSLEQEKRYRERRQKNNQAAKHSRSKRRERENVLRLRVEQLEAENLRLRQQLDEVNKKHAVVSGAKLSEKQPKRLLMSCENSNSSYLYN